MTDQPLGAIFPANFVIRCGYCQRTEVLDGAYSMADAVRIAREQRWHSSKAYRWICHTCRHTRPAHGSIPEEQREAHRLKLATRPQIMKITNLAD